MSLVADIIAQDPVGMEQLRAARALGLTDWCIAAGFVRNRVWDHLHGISPPRPPADIDVLYYDADDLSKEVEARHEARLDALMPGLPWQVRNQARMHLKNGDPPYAGTADAIRYWLETCTAIAVRLEPDDRMSLIAPYGLDDLFALVCRPTPAGLHRAEAYRARVTVKAWHRRWPECRIE